MPVYKRKERSKWYAKVYYVDDNGKYKQVASKYYDTKKDANNELAKMQVDKKKEKSKITFNQIFDEYLEEQRNKVKPITHSHYEPLYRYAKDLIGDLPIETLTISKYKYIKTQINKLNLSTGRKNRLHKLIVKITEVAYKNYGVFNDVPKRVGGFEDPTKIKKDIQFFTEDDFRLFRSYFENDIELYTLYGVLFYEGLRLGEALALDWKSIDLENGFLTINKTYTSKINAEYKTERFYITSPKTKSANRTIPIEKSILKDIKVLYDYYNMFEGFNKKWFVFGGIRPMSETKITEKKNAACEELGLEKITLHQLRHSCISYLANNGVDPLAIKDFVGHSKLSTTMDIYTHVYKNKIDNIFSFKK